MATHRGWTKTKWPTDGHATGKADKSERPSTAPTHHQRAEEASGVGYIRGTWQLDSTASIIGFSLQKTSYFDEPKPTQHLHHEAVGSSQAIHNEAPNIDLGSIDFDQKRDKFEL